MEIIGPQGVGSTQPIKGKKVEGVSKIQPPPTTKTQQPDKVDLSLRAQVVQFVEKLKNLPDIREDKVREIRKLIEEGKYETPEKLEKAVENFIRREVLGE